jgi:hypothetical protein
MTTKRRSLILALAAALVVSCTCSLLPLGPDLSQSLRLGSYITVNYPEEWYGIEDYGMGIFSPDYIDLDADDEDIDQPFMMVFPLDDFLGSDWLDYVEDPEELLDEMASEFDVVLRSTTTVEAGDVRWTKGTFSGPFGELPGTWEGWLAIELLPRGGAIIIAVAPESDWSDVDNIFDAMMKGMDFAD